MACQRTTAAIAYMFKSEFNFACIYWECLQSYPTLSQFFKAIYWSPSYYKIFSFSLFKTAPLQRQLPLF